MFDKQLKLLKEAYEIEESINDSNLFKAVILAGGPGSGKSFIAKKALGQFQPRIINSDDFFEFGLHKAGLPMKVDPEKQEIYSQQMDVRDRGKKSAKNRFTNWINGMLPIIIDGTGKDTAKVGTQKEALEKIGYDVYMMVVLADVEVALKRNAKRERSVPDKIVIAGNKAVRENLPAFEQMFGSDRIHVVDNSKTLGREELAELSANLDKVGKQWFGSPVQNPKGQEIMQTLESTGGKYLDDLYIDWRTGVPKV
jgi:adenylate kinase